MSDERRLDELRAAIDAVDDELLVLLNRRAGLTIEVGEFKRAFDPGGPFYRPEREARILRRLQGANHGPMPSDQLLRLMREVISTCLSLEKVLGIAYLGPQGTYTHAALLKHFGAAVEAHAQDGIAEVFREVESGACDYGVVPLENSIGGSVNLTLDCLAASTAHVCAEIVLPIHHQLLARADSLDGVVRIYAHEQALGQCRNWLVRHLPEAELVPVASNAAAARRAASEPGAAAIAGRQAAQLYELELLAHNIEDEPHNTTRFAVLGRTFPSASGEDRTMVMFSTPNEAGSLHRMLSELAARNISMSRIESRPLPSGVWDYRFFVDLLGHADDPHVGEALEAMRARAAVFKILGSFPRAVI